jgi:hypothetical protein
MTDSEKKKWTIELTEAQAREIHAALDFKARIMIGQFADLTSLLCSNPAHRDEAVRPNSIRHAVAALQALSFPEFRDEGASYGVGCAPEVDRLWDMRVMIRNTIARSKAVDAERRFLVDQDDPAYSMFSDWPPLKVYPSKTSAPDGHHRSQDREGGGADKSTEDERNSRE